MVKTPRLILIDADVIGHFITAGEQDQINQIFPNTILVLDKVKKEASVLPYRAPIVEALIEDNRITVLPFPEHDEVIKQEYFYIKKTLDKGDGESACLAVARFSYSIIASSNLKDIKNYCTNHKIDYLTTMDFLCYALSKGKWTRTRCDAFIKKVKEKKQKLPCNSMAEYTCRQVDFLFVEEKPEEQPKN
jgi:hypothetical protein